MDINIELEERCEKCYGEGKYYFDKNDEMVDCDCLDGMRLTEFGEEIIKLVKKYIEL